MCDLFFRKEMERKSKSRSENSTEDFTSSYFNGKAVSTFVTFSLADETLLFSS